jgi:hypothetical protein
MAAQDNMSEWSKMSMADCCDMGYLQMYMKLVTKYQISAINSYWEKCEEKYLGRTEGWTEVKQYTPSVFGPIRFLLPVCRLLIFIHIEHTFCICPFIVAFFSATIDGRNLIFGHKLHIGTPYRVLSVQALLPQ